MTFEARRTQIRLLRQGINSKPFWIVSLSVPGREDNTFSQLAVVRVNANSGKVEDVTLAARALTRVVARAWRSVPSPSRGCSTSVRPNLRASPMRRSA